MAKKLIKKCQKVTKTIIKKMGQCTHINSNHVHNCVKHIRNRVHHPFSNYFGLDASLQKTLGGVTYQYMLILAKNVKNGQNKASKYVQFSSKSCIFEWGMFEIGFMPLRRIYLGLASPPKIILGE